MYGIRISESRNFLVVESGILGFESGIQLQESAPTNNWNPACKITESSNWNPETKGTEPQSVTLLDYLT